MTETITLPRSVVEQALDALQDANTMMEHRQDVKLRHSAMADLRAALEQPQDHHEQHLNMVPEGWKLVPVEPTSEMLDAGRNACEGRFYPQDMLHGPRAMMADSWAAMLDAAPQPPVVEQPQGEQEPVAWIEHEWSGSSLRHLHFERPAPTVRDEVVRPVWTPLYTHPQPKRQPLTQEQIEVIEAGIWNLGSMDTIERESNTQFARAIERAHGIGGEA